MKRDCFVETSQVSALRDAVMSAKDAGEGFPAMVMAYGEPGTGKTKAARSMFAELGGVYLRALEGMTQSAFLQDLCFEVNGSRPHGAAKCKSSIMTTLKDGPMPLFVDEADRLHVSRLEDLRDIHDITGSPVILIGEMGLPTRVSARSRINDRIPQAFRVHFDSIGRTDIMLYAMKAANLALTPEAASVVDSHTKGNFRRVHNAMLTLEAAAKANATSEISADLARASLAQASGKGGRS